MTIMSARKQARPPETGLPIFRNLGSIHHNFFLFIVFFIFANAEYRQNAAALFLQDLQGKAPRTPLIQNLPTIPSTHQKIVNKPPPRIKSDVKRAKTGEFMMNQVGQHLFQMLLVRDIRRKFVLTLQNHAMNDLVSKVKIQKQRVEIERRKKTSNTIISVDTGAQLKRKLETAVNQPVPVKRTRIDPVSGEPSLRVDDVFSDSEDDEETSRGSRASKDRSPRASQGDSDDDMGSSIPELPDTIMYTPASPIHDPLFDRSVNFLQNTVLEAHNYSSKFKAQHQVPAKTADAIFFDKLDAYEIEDNEEPDFYRHTELDFYLSLNGKTSSSILAGWKYNNEKNVKISQKHISYKKTNPNSLHQ